MLIEGRSIKGRIGMRENGDTDAKAIADVTVQKGVFTGQACALEECLPDAV